MVYPDTFQISQPSDREIQVTRNFGAPRQLVFDAFTKPDLVKRWLLGPPGWTMPVCEIDLKAGGGYRYVWSKPGVNGAPKGSCPTPASRNTTRNSDSVRTHRRTRRTAGV